MKLDLTSPKGRFVSGSLTELQKTDHSNKPLPENKWHYYFGLAVPKTDPTINNIIQQMFQLGTQVFARTPGIIANMQKGLVKGSGFAWKIDDGDLPNTRTGQQNENTVGCYVLKFSTTFPIVCVNYDNSSIEREAIKRGDYIDVAFRVKHNGMFDHTAGFFVNPNMVRFRERGKEIAGGPTADQLFGAAAPAPALGLQTPVAAPQTFTGFGTPPTAPVAAPQTFGGFATSQTFGTPVAAPQTTVSPGLPNFPGAAPAAPVTAIAPTLPETNGGNSLETASVGNPPPVQGFAFGTAQ
jgi:hypothetical protein